MWNVQLLIILQVIGEKVNHRKDPKTALIKKEKLADMLY